MNHMLHPNVTPPVYRFDYYCCPKCGNRYIAIRGKWAICKDYTGRCMHRGWIDEFECGHMEE